MRTLGTLLAILTAFAVFQSATARAGELADLGAAQIVASGIVMHDARFVPPPYELRATREERELVIRVAGHPLDRLPISDLLNEGSATAVAPPPEYRTPEGVEALSGSGYPLYLNRLLKYYASRFETETAFELMEDQIASSRLVVRFERIDDGFIIFDENDDPHAIVLEPCECCADLTADEVATQAENIISAYQRLLAAEGAILAFDDTTAFLPPARVRDLLLPSVKVLEDTQLDTEAKSAQLTEWWGDRDIVHRLLTNYEPNAELRARLDEYERR